MPKEEKLDSGVSWLVEQMRLTAFTLVSEAKVADTWWESVVGASPETKTVKFKSASQTIEGHLESRRLVLNVDLNRVDWVMSPVINLERDSVDVPNIGSFDELKEIYNSLSAKWFSVAPAIVRLAWGVTLVQGVKDRVEGYKSLQKYLPNVQLDAEGSSEFLYQINRKRDSKVISGLTINRLQKWSVLAFHRMAMELVVGGEAGAQQQPRGVISAPVSACRLELDINTQPDRTEQLASKDLNAVYLELLSLGEEIATRGDIA